MFGWFTWLVTIFPLFKFPLQKESSERALKIRAEFSKSFLFHFLLYQLEALEKILSCKSELSRRWSHSFSCNLHAYGTVLIKVEISTNRKWIWSWKLGSYLCWYKKVRCRSQPKLYKWNSIFHFLETRISLKFRD